MLTPMIVRRPAIWVGRLLIAIALLSVAGGCSDDATGVGSGGSFTEGLTFTLLVHGAWSSDRSDPDGRTQGLIRVSVANQSQSWLGSDAMSHVGDSPDDERFRTIVRFADLEPGAVTVRVAFQHYDSSTDKEIVSVLKEITTYDGQPIEIRAEKITDVGTVEIAIPQE